MQERETGVVLRWDEKGFGFIRLSRDLAQKVFAHHSEIVMNGFRILKPGQRVSFVMVQDQKKRLPHAIDVQIEEDGAQN